MRGGKGEREKGDGRGYQFVREIPHLIENQGRSVGEEEIHVRVGLDPSGGELIYEIRTPHGIVAEGTEKEDYEPISSFSPTVGRRGKEAVKTFGI